MHGLETRRDEETEWASPEARAERAADAPPERGGGPDSALGYRIFVVALLFATLLFVIALTEGVASAV